MTVEPTQDRAAVLAWQEKSECPPDPKHRKAVQRMQESIEQHLGGPGGESDGAGRESSRVVACPKHLAAPFRVERPVA